MTLNKLLRVLIVDDQETICEIIRRQIEKLGHTVIGKAYTGKEAVERTKQLLPDVVLMDIEMPEMDGLEATKIIQEEVPTPVILLTSHENAELIQKASQSGAAAYLMKPPRPQEIERTLIIALARFSDLMEMRRLNGELRNALESIKVLTGLLPICSYCKKIRNDKGYWEAVESYLTDHTEAQFSYGICPSCAESFDPESSATK